MTIIENDILKASFSTKGAQLTSLYHKPGGIEHMWQANADVWPWHAPNLFPVVGGLINNQLKVDNKLYDMKRHGFARESEFLLLDSDSKQAHFSLPYNDTTLQVYPYKFDFHVIYDLIDNALRVTYKVINLDHQTIYFSVGGHPAFNVPFNPGESYEDYYLEFETAEPLIASQLSAQGFFNGETNSVPLNGKYLQLTKNLFAHDALVFKNLKSRQVTIKSNKHQHSLTVEFPHFNYLGLWAKPGADFVCIEPWLGCADTEGQQRDIKEKEDIQHVEYGHVFEVSYYISI